MSKKKNWVILSSVIATAAVLILGSILWTHKKASEKAPAFLPGVYACVAQNEFCRIEDTLVIRRSKIQEDNYTVTRTSSFIRIKEGRKEPPELQQQRWDAAYQATKCRLVSFNEADTVCYYPEKNRVSKAGFYYEKIE